MESLIPKQVLEAMALPDAVIKVLGLVLICIIVWIIGIISKQPRISKKLKSWLEPLIYRIPLLSHLFKITNQVASTFRDTDSFKRVVLVRFPYESTWAVGFMTNENPRVFRDVLNEPVVSVVVLASPPTSSFVLLVNPKDIIETDVPVSTALSYVISMGVAGAVNPIIEESHSSMEGDFLEIGDREIFNHLKKMGGIVI